jgi:hypothetical protein
MADFGGFEHNLQSLRVVDQLEERYPDFDGLNLCFETREGILKHCSRTKAQTIEQCEPDYADGQGGVGARFLQRLRPSLEAQLCNLADEIAYNAHDIDDGVRSGLITFGQAQSVPLFADFAAKALTAHPALGEAHNARRWLYETIRLNPSSPIAMRRALEDVTLRSGLVIKEGSTVIIDLMAVNRDVAMYGADAAEFNPHRQPADSTVSRWGLSFGSGMHACIGQELAAGLNERSQETSDYEYGLSTVAVQSMFDRGVRPDPAHPPQMDTATSRPYWGSYSVLLG